MGIRIKSTAAAILAGAAGTLTFVAAPAIAQDDELVVQAPRRATSGDHDLRMQRVSYRDLNLATYEGERAFRKRVGRAVDNVCLTKEGQRHGLTMSDYYDCKTGAWRRAWPQMTNAIYTARQLAYRR